MKHNVYHDAIYWEQMRREHPIGDDFIAFAKQSRDALRVHQEKLFLRCVTRAWQIPFYQRLWGNAGVEPGDIKGLETLPQLPVFDKSDIMSSIDAHPPFGDFGGIEGGPNGRPPVIMHTTSGTTGNPQVLLFGAKSREVQCLMLGRLYQFQGMRPDDVVHSVYGHGMINGGHYVREAVTHWTNSIFMSAGTGIETRSAKQVELMRDFGTTVIVGFADYIKKLARVAEEMGVDPVKDLNIRMISGHLGREDKASLSDAWGGVDCFDWYGVGDTGIVAGEGPDRDGLYVMEDGQIVEVCDIDTGKPVPDGQPGDIICTCIHKDDVYPIIRFNTHDVTKVVTGSSSLGINFKRIEGFLGRSDNMVKIRGINIFPQAMGPLLEADASFAGDFICKAVRDAQGRDEFVVCAEVSGPRDVATVDRFKAILKKSIGIECGVELAAPGDLAPLTQTEVRQKPIRLIDERFK
jgi:phenylacetate-CoA ligase